MKEYLVAIQLSLYAALITFVTSVVTLMWYYILPDGFIARFNLACLFIFGALNLLVFLLLAASLFTGEIKIKPALFAAAAQLINIPIALLCIWLIGQYLTRIVV